LELTITLPSSADRATVFGPGDRSLKLVRDALGVRMVTRGSTLKLIGDRAVVLQARDVLRALHDAAKSGAPLNRQQIHELVGQAMALAEGQQLATPDQIRAGTLRADDLDDPAMLTGPAWVDHLSVFVGGKPIRAKTPNQEAYLTAIRDFDLVFGVGPAGTGKTYLAVAAAVHLLRLGRVKRIVLCRPAVEAGERLGFLPGDLQEKVNPYLRPLLDALTDMMDYATLQRFIQSDVIEVVPLAFMRGRTLNRSIIILDEAQNTTRTQMKMFLTRMGMGSKIVVTGDPTQTDLDGSQESGLIDALKVLSKTPDIAICGFDETDIVRSRLVQRVVEAYSRAEGTARTDAPRSSARRARQTDRTPRALEEPS
jgi:phosphate starvation-inducible protein PhoH and related proteins